MLENIDYKKIFTYFEEISNVPRGSRHNEKISAYLVDFARKRGLEYRADEAYNVVIKKRRAEAEQVRSPLCCKDIWIWYVSVRTANMIF